MFSTNVLNAQEVAPSVSTKLFAYSATQDTSYTTKPATKIVLREIISIARGRFAKRALMTA